MGDKLALACCVGAVASGAFAVAGGMAYGTGQMAATTSPAQVEQLAPPAEPVGAKPIDSPTVAAVPPGAGSLPDHRYWLKCERTWKSNWQMREVCETAQEKAKQWAVSTVIDDDVGQLCGRRWSDDWVMFKACVDQQASAKARLMSKR